MKQICLLLVGLWALGSLADSSFVSELWVRDDFLKAPKAAFVAGAYAQLGQSDASLALGVIPIPFPIEMPETRGPLLYNPFPSYSHRGALSEWGRGWDVAMSIYHTAESGEVDCGANSFASPWGKLQASNQADVYYPKGLEIDIRVVKTSGGFTAYHPEGKVFEFTEKHGEFAWYLTQVKDREGHKTLFEYTQNSFHRPLLSKILHGGKKRAQYETQISYERLSFPVKRYGACGLETTIESRVHQIELKDSSKLHRLVYDDVYLSKVETEFQSKARLPDVDYHYGKMETVLKKPHQRINYQFQDATDGLDDWRFFSRNISWVDFNQDGLMDIERATDLKSFIQRSTGGFQELRDSYVVGRSALCPPSGSFNSMMAPAELRRLLIRPSGLRDRLVHLRLANDVDVSGTRTTLIVCNLDGQVQYQKEVFHEQELGMSFEDSTHLVDFNGDLKPDLVRVGHGQYTYILGESTPNQIQFSNKVTRSLPGADNRRVITYNLVDFNSDGFVDVVAQVSDGVLVWYGKGMGVLGPEEFHYPFKNPEGFTLFLRKMDGITLIDVNRDGLVDLLGRLGSSWTLFVQKGENLAEQEFPALDLGLELLNSAKVVNLSAGGNDQLAVLEWRLGYVAFDLNEPSTGLLTRIENNQGLSFEIDYTWTKPQEGVPQLLIVPKSLTIAVAGQEPRKRFYEFANAEIDVKNGGLIGFKRVETKGSKLLVTTDFLVSSDFQPKAQSITQVDARVDISQMHKNVWGESVLEGIRYLQLIKSTQSYVSQGLETFQRAISFSAYDRLCAKAIFEKTPDGELERQIAYSGPVGCLKTGEKLIGRHDNHPALDFVYTTYTTRNNAGQATDILLLTASKNISQTKFAYDDNHNVQSVEQASTGKTFLHYDPVFEILNSLQNADGTTLEMTGYAAQADSLSGLAMRHGDGADFIQEFAYDDLYRLHKIWNNLGESSTLQPLSHYAYRFGNKTFPSAITAFSQTDVGGYSQAVSLATADGQELTTVKENNDGWYFSKLSRQIPTESKVQEVNLDHLQKNPAEVGFIDLDATDKILSETTSSPLWGMLDRWTAVSDEQQNNVTRHLKISPQGIQVVSVENNQYATHALLDLQEGKPTSYSDETGRRYAYERDLLGRIRQISLPGQENHTRDFDAFGRVSKIRRSHIGEVAYSYEEDRNLLSQKNHYDAQGQWLRQESYGYDSAGRMTSHIYKDKNGEETYAFGFDGQDIQEKGQLGFFSQIENNYFIKKFVYAADGQAKSKNFDDKKGTAFQVAFKYNRVRDLAEQTVVYQSGKNAPLSYKKQFAYDDYGQLKSIAIADELLEIERDRLGKIACVLFPDGKILQMDYDSLTSGRKGYRLHEPKPGKKQTSYHWNFNDRGLISNIEVSSSIYGFAYSPDKMLQTHFSGYRPLQEWAYDKRGLAPPNRSSYLLFNDAGSLIAKNKQHYQLGPQGRIASFQSDRGQINYSYDENLHRVGKYLNDQLEYVRFEGLIGTPAHVYEKLSIEGMDIGFLVDGHFRFALFDQVGSLVATDNFFSMPSPFGERDVSSDLQEHFDFATHGRDKDTGFISMGVRDYDPEQQRFISADPFFLEDLDACSASPVECDLYSYARNNPLLYADSDGQMAQHIAKALVVLGRAALPYVAAAAKSVFRENVKTWARDFVLSPTNERGLGTRLKEQAGAKEWRINNPERVLYHPRYKIIMKDPNSKQNELRWWSKDTAGHGGSAWKVFKETSKGLIIIENADKYGNFMPDKHQGEVGKFIPWGELRSVK